MRMAFLLYLSRLDSGEVVFVSSQDETVRVTMDRDKWFSLGRPLDVEVSYESGEG